MLEICCAVGQNGCSAGSRPSPRSSLISHQISARENLDFINNVSLYRFNLSARGQVSIYPLPHWDFDPAVGEGDGEDDERRRHAEDDDVRQWRLHRVLPLPFSRRLPVPAISPSISVISSKEKRN